MAATCEHSEFIKNKHTHLMADKCVHKRAVRSARRTKVPLIVLSVFLGFALAGICALSFLYFSSSSCEPCEYGWTAYGGKCYFFSSETRTWIKSRKSCEGLKSHLVTISNSAIQGFLASKIKDSHWIGLNDLETEGHWVWINKQTLNETGVQFWFKKASGDEPDDAGGEDCACLGYLGSHLNSWFDASCETQKKFICEKKN